MPPWPQFDGAIPEETLTMKVNWIAAWSVLVLPLTIVGPAGATGGRTRIAEAVRARDAAGARALPRPSTVNVAEADGTTPLHWAADLDDLPAVKLLVAAGAKVK